MRRFVLLVAVVSPLLAACEDGPNQTYSPAPGGAAGVWNGPPGSGGLPDGGTFSGTGNEGYDASFGGTNANVTCTPAQAKATWTGLFQENIQIPGLAGGIDIAGGPMGNGASGYVPGQPFTYDPTKETWVGTTVEQAEAILCSGTADSVYYGVTNTLGWGNGCPACELSVLYNTNNRIITELLFQYGYVGNIVAKSADGMTTYTVGMNNVPMTATNSQGTTQLIINWNDATQYGPIVNELYDAIRNTYTPTFPPDTDCIAAGHCIIGNNFTQGGYFFFTSLDLAIFVDNTLAPQPAASTPGLISLSLLKLLPFSIGAVTMKLDSAGEGPLDTVTNVANSGNTCVYKLGMAFSDFDSQCVQALPAGNPNNIVSQNKLFGALAHTDEAYEFDIQGIDPQFAASSLAPNTVISDKQQPGATDVAYDFTVDQYEVGIIANDFTANDVTQPQDLHGLGMVTLEWANLVQTYMKKNFGVTSDLGNAACIANPQLGHCSGIEGIITTAPPALAPATMAVNALGLNALNVDGVSPPA